MKVAPLSGVPTIAKADQKLIWQTAIDTAQKPEVNHGSIKVLPFFAGIRHFRVFLFNTWSG